MSEIVMVIHLQDTYVNLEFPVPPARPGSGFGAGVGAVATRAAARTTFTAGASGCAAAGRDAFAGTSAEPPRSVRTSTAGAFGIEALSDGIFRPATANNPGA